MSKVRVVGSASPKFMWHGSMSSLSKPMIMIFALILFLENVKCAVAESTFHASSSEHVGHVGEQVRPKLVLFSSFFFFFLMPF